MSQSITKMLIETTKLLAYDVAELDPFFQLIAMCDKEYREYIAACMAYKILFGEDEFFEFLNEKVIPILQRIGQARFDMSEITHLGLKVGKHRKQKMDLSDLK